jgi:hypothetical protein
MVGCFRVVIGLGRRRGVGGGGGGLYKHGRALCEVLSVVGCWGCVMELCDYDGGTCGVWVWVGLVLSFSRMYFDLVCVCACIIDVCISACRLGAFGLNLSLGYA